MGFAPVYQLSNNGGGATASGASWNLSQNPGAGRTIVLEVKVRGSDTVASVSGLGASWTKINAVQRNTASTFQELWVGTGCSGALKAITVTMTGASAYSAWAVELGPIASATSGGTAKGSTGSPTLTLSGLSDGQMLIVASTCSATLTAIPAGWTQGTGGLGDTDMVYLLEQGSSNQTPAFGNTSNGVWGIGAVVLTPVAAAAEPVVMVV